MYKSLLIIIALSLHLISYGQSVDSVAMDDSTEKIFVPVEVEANFPGGAKAWNRFLVANVDGDLPTRKKAPAGAYTVVIQFAVDREGKLTDFKPLTNHGFGMEEEVIRVLKHSPRWEPASQKNRFVKAYRKQPVTFQVIEEKKKRKKKDQD